MSQIESEIKHNIEKGQEYADLANRGATTSLNILGRFAAMFWHEHSLQYQPGIGYLQIQHPSPMDRFLDRLLGGSRSIPRLVRVIEI